MDPTAALSTTRRFAQARCLPTDPRRAASLEAFSISHTPPATSPSHYRLSNLARMATEFDRWEQYWPAVLAVAQRNGDELAYTAVSTFNFVVLSTLSVVFSRWTKERKSGDGRARPALSGADWDALQRTADACRKMVYSVSVEAAQEGSLVRAGEWKDSSTQDQCAFRSLSRRHPVSHSSFRRGSIHGGPESRVRLQHRPG